MGDNPQGKATLPRWRAVLDTAATVLTLVTCIAILAGLISGRRPHLEPRTFPSASRLKPKVPSAPVPIRDSLTMGDHNAEFAIIMFSEFQCPFCAAFAQKTLPMLEQEYVRPGKLALSFRHFPLEQMHAWALKDSEAAECAARQGKFWQMHDLLFQTQSSRDETRTLTLARTTGLNLTTFRACLAGEATQVVHEDVALAQSLGIHGTPTFLVGILLPDGRVAVRNALSGVQSIDTFRTVLRSLSAENKANRLSQ